MTSSRRRSRLALTLALAALAGATACNKKSAAPAAVADDDDGTDTDTDDDGDDEAVTDDQPSADDDAPRPRRRRAPEPTERIAGTVPLTLAAAEAALPHLDAQPLDPPAASPSGSQVRFTYCLAAGDLEAAGTSVKASLQAARWERVGFRPSADASTSPRVDLTGQKDDLRLSVTVQAIRRDGCDAAENQFYAVVAMRRMAPGTPDEPAPVEPPPPAPSDPAEPMRPS